MKSIVILLIIVLIAVGYFLLSPQETSQEGEAPVPEPALEEESQEGAMMEKEEETMMEEPEEGEAMMMEEAMEEEGAMMEKEESAPVSQATGTYATYSAERVAEAPGDVLLFFAASWCPSCRALDSDITNKQGDIPSGVTILKVDYDRETALKQEHGITYQHTIVQVDNEGQQLKKWSGGNTLGSLLAQL